MCVWTKVTPSPIDTFHVHMWFSCILRCFYSSSSRPPPTFESALALCPSCVRICFFWYRLVRKVVALCACYLPFALPVSNSAFWTQPVREALASSAPWHARMHTDTHSGTIYDFPPKPAMLPLSLTKNAVVIMLWWWWCGDNACLSSVLNWLPCLCLKSLSGA